MTLVAIGVDHRTAPVDFREALAFDGDQARRFLTEDAVALPERLLVSTCNRTELFAVTPADQPDRTEELAALLLAARGMDKDGLAGRSAVYREEEAVRHLFRVSAGIESMVLGEPQILGQVKDAGELAAACGASGPVMRRLVETAVRVGKRARRETVIGEGAVSVASAAVELAGMVFGNLAEHGALVVGAGETGALVARHLRRAGIGRLFVANRTLNRAVEIAGEVKGEPWGLCGIPPGLREADIVVTATSASEPVITHEELRSAMRVRKSRTLLILDIAVPRDVEPAAARLEGLFLHDVDALNSIVDENLEVRRRAVPKVEAMVEEAVGAFFDWRRELEVLPTVKELRSHFEEIRQEELAKNLKRIPPEAREQAERLTESLVKRLLHEPTVRIREAGRGPDRGRGLVAVVRRIFGMGENADD